MLRRGFLYWTHLDKRRPALLLSPDVRNERASDVIVVPATTVLREGPWHVRLKKGEGGLASASMLACEQIMTVPKDWVEATPIGGPLSGAQLVRVVQAVLTAIGAG
jgi:mRNA interferase MazF